MKTKDSGNSVALRGRMDSDRKLKGRQGMTTTSASAEWRQRNFGVSDCLAEREEQAAIGIP